MKTPFFLLSSGRSGSTLLSSMLNMHPGIHVPVELWGLYTKVPRTLHSYGDLSKRGNAMLLSRDLQCVGQLNEFGIRLDHERLVELLLERDGSPRSVIECFYETLLLDSKKQRIGDKTPNNLPFIQELGNVFPDAKIVHLVRDGRDCALSMIRSRSGLNYRNVFELGVEWPADNRHASEYGERHPANYYSVRYEDLIGDPGGTLEQLCDYLEETFASEMLDYSEGEFAKVNSTVLSHHRNLGKTIIRDNFAKWRTGLSSDQVKVYEYLAGDVLRDFGYAAENDGSGIAWRLLLASYWCTTKVRKAIRSARGARKALWRSICIGAKRVFGIARLRDVTAPLRRFLRRYSKE